MRNFRDTFESPKLSFINAFLICVSIPLKKPGTFQNTYRFQFIPSFITTSISRCELFDMFFNKDFKSLLEYSLEH